MRSIFFRIYTGMFLAILAVMLTLSVGTYYLNKYRVIKHISENYGGTFKLISEGLHRHQGEQGVQWLKAIENLSDLTFKQKSIIESPLTMALQQELMTQQFAFKVEPLLTAGKAYILLPDNSHYLQVNLADFGSSLVRLSAFLVLNELGRHKGSERVQALNKLRQMYNYPIQLKLLSSLHIPNVNVRSVQKGNISVILKNPTSSTASLIAYAPLGNSPYSLVLGSIPFFNWFPIEMIASLVIIILILMALVSFLLVRPLELRLQAVDKQIEAIGQDKDLFSHVPKRKDAIGNLSTTVDAMAIRIHRLLDAQNDMVRAISHELRTPVTRIRFRLTAIEDIKAVEVNQYCMGIERDLTELESLIDEVLTFSKLQRDMPKLTIVPLEAGTLFNMLVKSAQNINPHIEINLVSNDAKFIFADQRYFYRVLENILTNALKYTKTKVDIGFTQSASKQIIWFADDGPGVPEHLRESLFTPFFRIDDSRNKQTGGYGLGLAIVKQIIQWHGGEVSMVESEHLGAKIELELPLKLQEACYE